MPGDTRTRAARNKAIRQEAIREQISAGKHHLHLVESIEEIDNAVDKLSLDKIRLKAEIRDKLMRKYVPDLKSMEYVDNTPKSVTFNFFGEQPNVPQPIEASVIDAKPIEHDDKGDTKIVDDSVTESLPVSK